jgi:hypothetical protein
MEEIEYSAQNAVAAFRRFVQFITWLLAIAEINELPDVQIQAIRPEPGVDATEEAEYRDYHSPS